MGYKNGRGSAETSSITSESDVFFKLLEDRVLFLCKEIDVDLATNIVANLLYLNKKSTKKEITLYINSNGGTVPDGLFTIHDTIQCIEAPVKTICIGEALSSAAVILASGTKGRRFAYPSSRMMIHNMVINDMFGTKREIEEESKRINDINNLMLQIIAVHTGQNIEKVAKDCECDTYFTPEEAIKYGLIDHIMMPAKIVSKRGIIK